MSDDEQQEVSATPDYGESDQVAKPQGDRCPRCGDRAYHAESIAMEGMKFHKRCFSCRRCKKKLDSTNACSHEREVYCKGCHTVEFGIKGYGYGLGAGALTRTQ
ncbi:Muscle LIM protein Mlp84B [Exaiptasia diaphana]|nr:Muscle LIM protein Mlp84B [Exaiptasia diaphana]